MLRVGRQQHDAQTYRWVPALCTIATPPVTMLPSLLTENPAQWHQSSQPVKGVAVA